VSASDRPAAWPIRAGQGRPLDSIVVTRALVDSRVPEPVSIG
jgi:hypothetical protein